MRERTATVKGTLETLTTIAVLLAAVVFLATQGHAAYRAWAGTGRDLNVAGSTLAVDGVATFGNSDASVVLAVFSNFQCPACASFATRTLPEIDRRYVQTGKVRLVYRHLPLVGIHQHAYGAAMAAECARRQGMFWEMHDVLFANQRRLAESDLYEHAAVAGLGAEAFASCMASDSADVVARDLEEAKRFGMTSTPSFAVAVVSETGDVEVVRAFGAARPLPQFVNVLETALAGKTASWGPWVAVLGSLGLPAAGVIVLQVRRRRLRKVARP